MEFLSTLLGVIVGFCLGLSGQVIMQWRRDNALREQTKLSLSKELGYLNEQAASVFLGRLVLLQMWKHRSKPTSIYLQMPRKAP